MTRKMLTAAIAVTALLLSVMSIGADAQGSPTCPYNQTVIKCAKQEVYPGPFTNHPPLPKGPYGFGTHNIVAAAAAPAAGGGAGGGDAGTPLAVTGSESAVLGYVGTGLIAFGAVALGSRRKFFQGALED